MVNQHVARHLEQPGARLLQRAESCALAHRLDEDILQQILGRGLVAEPVCEVPEEFSFVSVPCRRYTGERNAIARRRFRGQGFAISFSGFVAQHML